MQRGSPACLLGRNSQLQSKVGGETEEDSALFFPPLLPPAESGPATPTQPLPLSGCSWLLFRTFQWQPQLGTAQQPSKSQVCRARGEPPARGRQGSRHPSRVASRRAHLQQQPQPSLGAPARDLQGSQCPPAAPRSG